MGRKKDRLGPPVGRHATAVAVVAALAVVFWWAHPDPTNGYEARIQWNRIMADVSFVLLCLVLTIGPVARLAPRARTLVPLARELGIAMFVTATLHVAIIIDEAASLSDALFGGYWFGLSEQTWGSAANWVGLVALAYAAVLAVTSNDFSQRLLRRGWKFLQRQTYTLFVLAVGHTAAFVAFWDEQPAFWLSFWVFTILVIVAQGSGFIHTVRSPRGPSPQRPPPNAQAEKFVDISVVYVKWVTVVVLWSVLVGVVYSLGHGEGF